MKTDSLFYRLFQTLPQLLFELIAQPTDHATEYRFDSVELKQTALRLDGVLLPPAEQATWPLFFVEVQFQLDPVFYSRLFAEIFLYLHHHRPVHPWHAVVIYPRRGIDPGIHPHYRALLESEQVTRVYLDEWAEPRQTLSQQLMSVLLADPQQAVNEARTVLAQVKNAVVIDKETFVNLVETMLVYKLPTLSREEIQAMLELTDVDLKQTRFYQDVFTEGRQEGRQEGEQAGRQAEGITLILRQLHRRCGELPPALVERITRLSILQLEALGEALLEFHEIAEVEQWLNMQAGISGPSSNER